MHTSDWFKPNIKVLKCLQYDLAIDSLKENTSISCSIQPNLPNQYILQTFISDFKEIVDA